MTRSKEPEKKVWRRRLPSLRRQRRWQVRRRLQRHRQRRRQVDTRRRRSDKRELLRRRWHVQVSSASTGPCCRTCQNAQLCISCRYLGSRTQIFVRLHVSVQQQKLDNCYNQPGAHVLKLVYFVTDA